MPTINEVAIKLLMDGKEVHAVITGIEGDVNKLGRSGDQSNKSMSSGLTALKAGFIAVGAAIAGVLYILNNAVNKASEYNEANSKMLVVFAGVEDAARKMRQELVDSYDMSYVAATKLLGQTGHVLTGLGMQRDKALELSGTVNKLAVDITSFSNAEGGAEAVSRALTTAMTGERESLKTYGIVIQDTDVKNQLLADGKDKLTGFALKQAQAEATLKLALLQSKDAIGDLARTHDSYANQQRAAQNALDNMALALGSVFLPIWNKVVVAFNNFIEDIGPEKIVGVMNAIYEVMKAVVIQMVEMIKVSWDLLHGFVLSASEFSKGNYAAATAIAQVYWDNYSKQAENSYNAIIDSAKKGYQEGMDNFKEFKDGQIAENKNKNKQMVDDDVDAEKERRRVAEKEREAWLKFLVKANEDQAVTDEELRQEKLAKANEDELFEIARRDRMATDDAKRYFAKQDAEKKSAQNTVNLLQYTLNAMAGQSKTAFEIAKAFNIAKAIMDTYAAAANALEHSFLPGPWAILEAIAIIGFGMAQVANIRAQKYTKYAKGGEIYQPTLALMGEAGAELIAPKKTFIDVTNELINKGSITSDNFKVIQRLDRLNNTLDNLKITSYIDAEKLAIVTEAGINRLAFKEF